MRSLLKSDNPLKAPRALFLVALTVRLTLLTVGRLYVLSPKLDHLAFGSEAGHIARALLTGRGYSDPFWWGHSGPTAWLAPGYPLLLTGIFKIFGIYTNLSAWVVLAVQCTLNAAAAAWIWEIGVRCFNRSIATWTAWIWALSPFVMVIPMMLPWETSITTALFAWVFVLTLRLRGIGEENAVGFTWLRWTQWGFCWGVIALFNPSLVLFLPCAGMWLMCEPRVALRRRIAGAALAAGVFAAILSPWIVRNELTFHQFIPTRGNLGSELCDGNCYGIEGVIGQWDHPNLSQVEMREYARVGEVEYNRERMQQFKQVLRNHPLQFVAMDLLRMDFYWFGVQRTMSKPFSDSLSIVTYCFTSVGGLMGVWLMWRRRLPAAGLFVMAILTVPALYYFVTAQERFRHPLEPLLYLLGGYAFWAAEQSFRVRWFTRAEEKSSRSRGVEACPDFAEAS